MAWYLAKMALLLPLLALLIWGSLRLTKHVQGRLVSGTRAEHSVELVETTFLGPGIRLAVVSFRGREILLGCSKQGLVRLAEAPGDRGTQEQVQ